MSSRAPCAAFFLLLAGSWLAPYPALAAAPALPDTLAGHLAGDFLTRCRTATVAEMTDWFQPRLNEAAAQRASAAERAGDAIDTCHQQGDFTLGEVVSDKPGSLTVKVRGQETGDWLQLILDIDAADKLDRIGLIPTLPPEASLPTDLSDAALAREVAGQVARLGAAGRFSGIAVVARGTTVIASATAGYADRDRKTPFTLDSRFTLASLGKMFTAAAVGQLVDQGKLRFGDTVGSVFPDYPNRTVRDQVTLGMLLSHTSGLGDFLDKRTPAMMTRGVARADEFMPLYDQDEPDFTPGSRWSYSNAGLALAGAMVEKRAGEDFPAYIRHHVLEPLRLDGSDPNNIPHRDAQLVTPYTRMGRDGPLPDWREAEHDIGSPGGGAISTARDLLRFAQALRDGTLMSRGTFVRMWQNHAPNPLGSDGYGYAMMSRDVYGSPMVGHGGGFPGVSTELDLQPDGPYTLVVLSNQDPNAAYILATALVALVVEKAKRGQ